MLASRQRGDTIIEVLLAVTVFSLVAVGSMTIMNRSANLAQQAVEITLVRQQLDAQAEALRAAHQAYSRIATVERDSSGWTELKSFASSSSIDVSGGCPTQSRLNTRNAFIMNPNSGGVLTTNESAVYSIIEGDDVPVYPQVITDETMEGSSVRGYGLWIEVRAATPGSDTANVPAAYNFRIRACWNGVGAGTAPMQLETTVRLYDVQS